ncbi:tRNA uridine-5-carboxymethylaminomethyl(34) synthesis GTPase MnmE [Flavobacteriaceae bacterium]|jgi:tRNA modification GTPase|uniref:tRNA modification GTPase MnmE n=1 Tax=uncultured Flavobacteriia bacterium TaxID=212695 RepID=H6RFS9_9BACT|nr:GTPase and tRNA-U34 5-formylation enzyme TrmE [uncultured bacterium]MBD44981.1 tRNA uridine-5-carboxymethylaminomethyl(34) synthesis GTPase MnmE [Flavobacteriaceae bacterium]CCF99890.1 tRNA modification GTPase MnmE [uncultured Flavobacteriia bacterium]MDA7824909.1 tRNA uridine-5-carboxymethylaminomethyl(34) synthesis GTPase MnmE [Flavobacteriaceae bacterium]MDA9342276.1 tRNA uridine-5-carboxymethylaminomethyl(34) synthesis GTPase MnmE [Flavobacteriaceae bacterium]|tara:strand:+ start:244 stop:1617 length:1374 start_codon:yes stop_codon:yes gene_type:complete
MIQQNTIVALATPPGAGAIAIIRLSGKEAITIATEVFNSISGKELLKQKSHTVHLGNIVDGSRIIDEVLATVFKNPNSYTGENVVEFSCHGSSYIQQEIIQLLLRKGCRMATAGEFTLQAFLNGKMDLSQAEAVADLIASDSKASHQLAIQQMRGGFSTEIEELRIQLLNFASLIELELDFSEEDVEFANREEFQKLIKKITILLKKLIDSFATGNVLKNGIPVAIVGRPNSGKSTLLNSLLNEERAIVSNIAGTTRDTIEDEITIGGIRFRFIDTAGLRETTDEIEKIGVERALEKLEKSAIYIYLFDSTEMSVLEVKKELDSFTTTSKQLIVANKIDKASKEELFAINNSNLPFLTISAKSKDSLDVLSSSLLNIAGIEALDSNQLMLTNSRHYDVLIKSLEEISKVQEGIDNHLTGDLLAIDLRQALYFLGEITGKVSNDDLLGNIFANFCIGK